MANVINATSTGNGGLVSTGDDSGILNIQTNETTAITVDASQNVGIGTASPAYSIDVARATGSASLGLLSSGSGGQRAYFEATRSGALTISSESSVGAIAFNTGTSAPTSERMRIDSSGNVGIGTSSPSQKLSVSGRVSVSGSSYTTSPVGLVLGQYDATTVYLQKPSGYALAFWDNNTNALMTLDSSGNLLVGTASTDPAFGNVKGTAINADGWIAVSRDAGVPLFVNRKTNDGTLIEFKQDGTTEGNISVSGTAVSYNGGHLSRWAQTTTDKDESLVKGTVLSNLDEMNVYTDSEGNPVDNEQLNKVKVSNVEGDVNVAGVFVNWSHDDAHDVDEINMAMTGDMIIRIAQGTTVARGDLLMSAGDGTAKPQGDDIIRSKTVAKVTSTHVTCTYADGSFCVPCVLMAC